MLEALEDYSGHCRGQRLSGPGPSTAPRGSCSSCPAFTTSGPTMNGAHQAQVGGGSPGSQHVAKAAGEAGGSAGPRGPLARKGLGGKGPQPRGRGGAAAPRPPARSRGKLQKGSPGRGEAYSAPDAPETVALRGPRPAPCTRPETPAPGPLPALAQRPWHLARNPHSPRDPGIQPAPQTHHPCCNAARASRTPTDRLAPGFS